MAVSQLGLRSSEFDEWVRPHVTVMRRCAVALDPFRDADDVVQDALERAWLRWDTYRADRGSARTWLLAIVADRARRNRRRLRNMIVSEMPSGAPDSSSPDWADLIDVRDAVRRLPMRQRQSVVLHYYVGLTVVETAAVLGCAAGTVKSALFDARANLAATLGERR